MKTHEIVIDAKLVFEIPAEHEVVAVTEAVTWLGERLTNSRENANILKEIGLNLGSKLEG